MLDCPFKKDTEKYQTARRFEIFEYLGKNETKNETILTHWSVNQAGSNGEKKLGVETLVVLSL